MVKNPSATAGDTGDIGSIPGSGRSPGERNGNLLQYSCLEHLMNRGAWWGAVQEVRGSDTTEHALYKFKYILKLYILTLP